MLAQWSQASPLLARRCVSWVRERKMPVAVSLAFVFAAACALAWQSHDSAQTSLFSVPLRAPQTAEVERALTIWNEPFASNAQHSEISVPAARRRDVLLRLTLAGLPHGYVPTSADVLDDSSNMLLSPAAIDDRRRAGIAGDLVAGLRRIDGIVDAMVVIAPASASPFDEGLSRNEASASVQLLLQPGAQLSTAQVAGIARFVAASYPSLSPARVTIVDGSGKLQAAQNSVEPGLSRELRLQSSIQSALDAVFGRGAAVVRVTLRSINGPSSTQATRTYPHGFLESESGRESGREKGRMFEKERNLRRYAYDTVVERRYTPAEAGTRIAVAVFLDQTKVGSVPPDGVRDLVRAAAGADVLRGDEVVVKTLPFTLVTAAPRQIAPVRNIRLARLFVAIGGVLLIVSAALAVTHVRNSGLTKDAQAAAAVRLTLQDELPQTAAYVLRSLPHQVRQHVLQAYDQRSRTRIESHLNGYHNG